MMIRNRRFFPVVLMILAGLAFAAVFSCNNGGGSVSSETFTGTDTDGKKYELIVTGTNYEFKIEGKLISTGKVTKNSDLWTLMPYGVEGDESDDFDVTIDGEYIAGIGGLITNNVTGGAKITPGEIVPPNGSGEPEEEGPWIWYAMDDSVPNDYLDVQTVFAPGGASRITNAKKVTNPDGTKGQKPFKYPEGTVMDNDGKPITETVYNFTGNTKVSKDNRGANECARFPMVGWGAKPNPDFEDFPATLNDLRSAKGYSFWVRLNSSTASNWVFLSAVDSAFDTQTPNDKEKGYEYSHWFGNQKGGSADGWTGTTPNFTGGLELGKWHKITVIMSATGRNIEQAHWIWQYNNEYKRVFNQNKAEQIQWQIPLQYQVGAGVSDRGATPYDIVKGSYDFNLDFYGFELIK